MLSRTGASALLIGLIAVLPTRPAAAGRSAFGWLQEVETQPERGAEIEAWAWELNDWHLDTVDRHTNATAVGWAAAIGITDTVELRVPVELLTEEGTTEIWRWGAEARWRLACPDPVEAPPVIALVRLGAWRMTAPGGRYRLHPGVVVSADLDRVRLVADLSASVEIDADGGDPVMRYMPAAGASVRVVGHLRAGVEWFSELGRASRVNSWTGVGPNLAWTHGRSWLAASFLVGTAHVTWAPRLNWGIAF